VFPVLMPLKAKGDLRLALSTEENNFLKILIVIVLPSRVVRWRNEHSISLLDNTSSFNLIHKALFAVEGITDRTSHTGFHCPPFFDGVKGGRQIIMKFVGYEGLGKKDGRKSREARFSANVEAPTVI
jgi:hypothetical protein